MHGELSGRSNRLGLLPYQAGGLIVAKTFLSEGCRASPLSVDVFALTPLPLILSMRCVIECIFGTRR